MIDSHCHLTAPQFAADFDAAIERAVAAGVERMICVADCLADIDPCLALAKKLPGKIFATAGMHPHHAKDFDPEKDLAIIRRAAGDSRCKAIGEIGLDYHYMNSPKEDQQRAFESQLVLAKELNLPAVVHCREAVEDVWTIVNHVRPQKLVLHCCSERWEDVKRFVEAGYFLSFTGIVTYPKSDVIRETVKQCPIDQLMVETDAPFLAPVPYRGKRCEPAHVMEVAKVIAEIKGVSVVDIDRITTKNAIEFFTLRP
ncbi:MAG: TatD family hydrolase [Candidatus Peribacteraceae bacterium]|nr:TatD family hydrolase [Candidatus Peribacteraceae bacterium]